MGAEKEAASAPLRDMLVTLGSSESNVSAQLYDACVGPEIDGRGDLAGGGISQYSAAVANVRSGVLQLM